MWVWRGAGSWLKAGTDSGWKIHIPAREYTEVKVPSFWFEDAIQYSLLRCPKQPVKQCTNVGSYMYTIIHFLMDCILTSILFRIHPNLKSTVYCNAIAFGGVEEWDFAWRMFKNATLASEASRLRSAMACTKVPWLLNRYVKQPDLWACPCSRFSLNETSTSV